MESLALLFLSLLLFVAGGVAAPATSAKKAIDADTLTRLNVFEQFAAAAYCTSNNDSPGTKLTCPEGNCPIVEAANTNTLAEFQDSVNSDVTGYVALDNTNKLIVVAFRGSRSQRNWLTNFNFPVIDTGLCPGCTAHMGFWASWLEARPGVVAAVQTASTANPSYQIVTTGHSLGGALASLAAVDLRNNGYKVALYTYGAPRIASATLSSYISNQPGGNHRVTHTNDPVPRVPFDFLDFSHIAPEYFIRTANNVGVTANDVIMLQGPNNAAGNAGQPGIDPSAHLWYFNDINACSPNATEVKRDLGISE